MGTRTSLEPNKAREGKIFMHFEAEKWNEAHFLNTFILTIRCDFDCYTI